MTKADDFDMFYATTSRRLVRQIFAMTGDLSDVPGLVPGIHGDPVGDHAKPRFRIFVVADPRTETKSPSG